MTLIEGWWEKKAQTDCNFSSENWNAVWLFLAFHTENSERKKYSVIFANVQMPNIPAQIFCHQSMEIFAFGGIYRVILHHTLHRLLKNFSFSIYIFWIRIFMLHTLTFSLFPSLLIHRYICVCSIPFFFFGTKSISAWCAIRKWWLLIFYQPKLLEFWHFSGKECTGSWQTLPLHPFSFQLVVQSVKGVRH